MEVALRWTTALGLCLLLVATPAAAYFSMAKVQVNPATLNAQFEEAQKTVVTKLHDGHHHDTKLEIYGLYQQATEGDVKGAHLGPGDSEWERKKHEAWAANQGMSSAEAKEAYIEAAAAL